MYKQSLKNRLVISLLFVFITLWSLVFTWLYIDLKQRLQDTLDQRLSASTHMVARLIQQLPLHNLNADLLHQLHKDDPQNLIACEVSLFSSDISVGQYVLAKTRGAPDALSQQAIGFSTWLQDDIEWRSYVLRKGKIQVVAAERLFLRDSLLQQIIQSVLVPLLLSLFLCITLIIFIIRKEFFALDQTSQYLSRTDLTLADLTNYMSQIDPKMLPQEVKPFVDNTIHLIQRLSESLEQEKAFSAYAAHELRSPLTAIKTHVQLVNLMIKQENTTPAIQHHLQQADHNIRRYTQLLEQLLLLTQSENQVIEYAQPTIVHAVVEDVILFLQPHYPQLDIVLEVNWQSLGILNLPPFVIFTTLKNLLENALLHAQANQISVMMHKQQLFVIDNGCILSTEDLSHLGQRFWRKSSRQSGHGLGLALSDALLSKYAYQLKFQAHQPQGLKVIIESSL